MQEDNKFKVILSLATLYLAWSTTYLAIRIALENFGPFFIAGFRYMLVGAGIYVYLRLKGDPAPTRAQWKGAAIAGVFLLLGGTGGVVYAEQWVGSGIAAMVLATSPLLTVVFASFWKHHPLRYEWIGMLLGFAGIIVLNLKGDLRAYPLGAGLLILASACWSFGSILSLHVPMPSGTMASAAQMFSGGLLVLVVSVSTGERLPADPSARAVGAMFWLAIFGSLLGYTAYTYLLKNVRPALATSYAYVNPLLAVLLGVFAAGEHITKTEVGAMALILAGVVLLIAGQKSVQTIVEKKP